MNKTLVAAICRGGVTLTRAVLLGTTLGLAHAAMDQPSEVAALGKSAPVTPAWERLDAAGLRLQSAAVMVTDSAGNPIYAKHEDEPKPIASVTKLMTAIVVLDAGVDLDATITIRPEDKDLLRNSRSRLQINRANLTRRELLLVALMSSDNRAAAALGRTTFAGGTPEFVEHMNRKAKALGMTHTHFADSSGLNAANRSTARDLTRLVGAASGYPLIRQATTTRDAMLQPHPGGGALGYRNTNPLVASDAWEIELSKTGYITDAGRCLVMQTMVGGRRLRFVLLDSPGKLTPIGDSNRLRQWIEQSLAKSGAG
jgi:serine-type D-Ala-D-Ala endopeptidase (penicillin-binding protein 7)